MITFFLFISITANIKSVSSITNTILNVEATLLTGPEFGAYKTSSEFPTLRKRLGASFVGFIDVAVKNDHPIAPNEWLARIKPPIVPFFPGKKDQALFKGNIYIIPYPNPVRIA